jgi:hypothetical protein
MSSVVISGDTSGAVTVSAPAVAGTNTLTLQAATATSSVNTLGTSVASTSGTAIDFTALPAWIKKITIMFVGVSGSSTSFPTVRLGDAGGIETSGYLGSTQSGTSGVLFTTGFEFASNIASAARLYHGAMYITLQNSSTNTWAATSIVGASDGASVAIMGGSKSLSETLTQVRITFVNGTDTFDAGSINILYEG